MTRYAKHNPFLKDLFQLAAACFQILSIGINTIKPRDISVNVLSSQRISYFAFLMAASMYSVSVTTLSVPMQW